MIRARGRSAAGPPHSARRAGVAAVEFAVVMNLVLVPMMIGLWEMGRAVHVQQVVSNAAREGARLASQGRTVTDKGSPIEITADKVRAAVYQSLIGSGLTQLKPADVHVTFKFLSGAAGNTNPVQGAKNDRFSIEVWIDFGDKVRWVNLGLVDVKKLQYTVEWRMLVDDPFEFKTDIPTW